MSNLKHVVIVGAGFAGLFAAKKLFNKNVKVTVLDRNNYHTFNPLLYQVGAAQIDPGQIAYPVRAVMRKGDNVKFIMAEVQKINFKNNSVITDAGRMDYDYLILAPGSRPDFFGIKGAHENTYVIKTLEDALSLRNHILTCFERANNSREENIRDELLTFIIAGGGATGVEFAGAFAELVKGPLDRDFPNIKFEDVKIILLEAADRILAGYSVSTSDYVIGRLKKMGVQVLLSAPVREIAANRVILADGSRISSHTVVWTAGVSGFDLSVDIKPDLTHDRRVRVNNYLQLEKFKNVFVCGDIAHFSQNGETLPMLAPVATQQGARAAENILSIISGKEPQPFRYTYKGSMIVVGRNSAVTKLGEKELKGFIAWVLWLLIHIAYLIGFRNKIFVMINWFSDYIFYERAGRIILPSCERFAGISGKKKS